MRPRIAFFVSLRLDDEFTNLNTPNEGGSARRGGTMGIDSPKARISGGKAAFFANALRTTRSTSPLVATNFVLLATRFNSGDFGEIWWEIVCGERLDIHFDQAHERTAEIRFGCAASIDDHADCRDDAAVRVHDIDCLLHAPSAGNDVFDHNEFLVRRNLKTTSQNEFAFVFLDKNMAFA